VFVCARVYVTVVAFLFFGGWAYFEKRRVIFVCEIKCVYEYVCVCVCVCVCMCVCVCGYAMCSCSEDITNRENSSP